jgi:UDP-GlcNAc:undecaprenyl-phosphate/decaprenyl-phosphate GlcNAc-1-phosphate transferase
MIAIQDVIWDYVVVAVSAFLISAVLTPVVRNICQQRRLLDFPTTPRKIHVTPVPRLGGIAIYVSFFLTLLAVFMTEGPVFDLFAVHRETVLTLFLTSTLVFAVGVYDDVYGATVLQKLTVQVMAAVLLYVLGFNIQLISVPLVGSVSPGMLGFPITILWVVGVTNALNFIDGIDGLACGVGFFAISTMFLLSLFLHRTLTAFFAAALAGGLFGFALYNFAPASIFMGDSGSLFIGFIIAAISLHSSQKSSTAVVLLLPVVALGVPIADTLLAIVRRLGNGHSPFKADKDHIHHRLLRLGLSSRQVTLVLYIVCSVLGIFALLMTAVTNRVLTVMLIILSVLTIGSMKLLGYTTDMIAINHLARKRMQQKKQFLDRQRRAEDVLAQMAHAGDVSRLEQLVIHYFRIMECDLGGVTYPFPPDAAGAAGAHGGPAGRVEVRWQSARYRAQEAPASQLWTLRVPLVLPAAPWGELEVGKYLGATPALLEDMLFVERLREVLSHALSHMAAARPNQAAAGEKRPICEMGHP